MRIGRIFISVFVLGASALAPLAFAGGEHGGSQMSHGYVSDSIGKLGRGVVNIVTTPAELSCAIYYDFNDNAWTAPITGTVKGAVLMVRRALVGVAEVASFPIPSHEWIPKVCNGKS
ncbi:MAG: hypothetical protein Q8R76_07810 [Candidatus Omnitrophota bacterium]|nr:hypothetical protein [Candidatus Omnitrophota bacterium]